MCNWDVIYKRRTDVNNVKDYKAEQWNTQLYENTQNIWYLARYVKITGKKLKDPLKYI